MAETDTMERTEVDVIERVTYDETSVETKTADQSCQRTMAATAILCAGCPLVAFCPKASTEPTLSGEIADQDTFSAVQSDMQQDGLPMFSVADYMARDVSGDVVVESATDDLAQPVENSSARETRSEPRPSYLDQLMDDSVPIVAAAPPRPAPSRAPESTPKPEGVLSETSATVAQASQDTARIELMSEQAPASSDISGGDAGLGYANDTVDSAEVVESKQPKVSASRQAALDKPNSTPPIVTTPTQERDIPRATRQPLVTPVPTQLSEAKTRNVPERLVRLIDEPDRPTEEFTIPEPPQPRMHELDERQHMYDDTPPEPLAPAQPAIQPQKSHDTPQAQAWQEIPHQNDTLQLDGATSGDREELPTVEHDAIVMVSPYEPLAEAEDGLHDEHGAMPPEPTAEPPFIHGDNVLFGGSEDTDNSHIVEPHGHKYRESADDVDYRRDNENHPYVQVAEWAKDALHDDEPEPAIKPEADTIDAPNLESQDDNAEEHDVTRRTADIASRVLDETGEQTPDEGIECILPQPAIRATTGVLSVVLVRLLAARALVTTLRLA